MIGGGGAAGNGTKSLTVSHTQISSMGSLDPKWLNEEFAVSMGAPSVAIVWPTVDTVRNSLEVRMKLR